MATLCAAFLSASEMQQRLAYIFLKINILGQMTSMAAAACTTVRAIRHRHLTAETQGHSQPRQCGIVTDQLAPGQVSLRLPLLSLLLSFHY